MFIHRIAQRFATSVSTVLDIQPIWRCVGFVASIVGLSCYALSPSFTLLFGEWNELKIIIYSVVSFIFSILMLVAKKRTKLSAPFKTLVLVGFSILLFTSLYSFHEDRSKDGKELENERNEGKDENRYESVLSPISSGAFALMSLSMSRLVEPGFEVGLFHHFLGSVLVTVMKIDLKFTPLAAAFCFVLISIRHSKLTPLAAGFKFVLKLTPAAGFRFVLISILPYLVYQQGSMYDDDIEKGNVDDGSGNEIVEEERSREAQMKANRGACREQGITPLDRECPSRWKEQNLPGGLVIVHLSTINYLQGCSVLNNPSNNFG